MFPPAAFGIVTARYTPYHPAFHASTTCSQAPSDGGRPSRSERESEISAKIERLRRQNKLPSQRESRDGSSTPASSSDGGLFARDIAEGEALFGTISNNETGSSPDGYRPRVSTWGVFPRPDNISRAYGGGRKLPLGGSGAASAEEREKDARIQRKLAEYLGGTVAEASMEAEHIAEIECALQTAGRAMAAGQAFEAANVLRGVLQFATIRSRLGGEIRLALALAYEETGRRADARRIYGEIVRGNRFTDIKRTAKRLCAGFEAMEKMRVEDGALDGQYGFRSSDFVIPDIAAMSEKRYETVVRDGLTGRRAQTGDGETVRDMARDFAVALLVLVALAGIPAGVVTFLRSRL